MGWKCFPTQSNLTIIFQLQEIKTIEIMEEVSRLLMNERYNHEFRQFRQKMPKLIKNT